MVDGTKILPGGCHCGAVRFEVSVSDGFSSIRRCNCSYCRMRGAAVIAVKKSEMNLLRGTDALTSYRFNTKTAQHFFCSRCGIHTHLQRRSDLNLYGVNVACLDGISPFDFVEVCVMDGINHPNDTGSPAREAGKLSFISATDRNSISRAEQSNSN
ncbi:MAG: GFA family protein [Bradyrhizobiaceae bacterium]|nr:MAG: GFA family protein [Bradyrhizobiaceae bacterium]